jgi:hypothetical protein
VVPKIAVTGLTKERQCPEKEITECGKISQLFRGGIRERG